VSDMTRTSTGAAGCEIELVVREDRVRIRFGVSNHNELVAISSIYRRSSAQAVKLNSTTRPKALQAEFTEAETKLRAAEKRSTTSRQERLVAVHDRGPAEPGPGNILAFTEAQHARPTDRARAKIAEMKKEQNEDVLSNPSS